MKPIFIILPLAAAASPCFAAYDLVNGGFEDSSGTFPNGWSTTGNVHSDASGGFGGGDPTSALLVPNNPVSSITQDFSSGVTGTNENYRFQLDLAFRTDQVGTGTDQRIRLRDNNNSGDLITLGFETAATGGGAALSFYNGTTWVRAIDSAISPSTTYHFRVIGSDLDLPSRSYTVALSTDGINYTTSGAITSFHSAVAGSDFETLRIESGTSNVRVDLIAVTDGGPVVPPDPDQVVKISGVYPHLAVTSDHSEVGIGAVAPWAGRLWAITYGPHIATGDSTNKLYEIDDTLNRVTRPESLGGTPANRFIHEPSNQLIMGPHFIDASRNVRNLAYTSAPGRYTATAAHLGDPENRVYIYTMECGVYDVNVNDLSFTTRYPDVQGTGDKFLFGYHGKGAYTGQGNLIVASNGRPKMQDTPLGPAGVLARWDGTTYGDNGNAYVPLPAINNDGSLENTNGPAAGQPQYMAGWMQDFTVQHCEVTGPGGIRGNANPATDPVWATGFDAKSVVLRAFEGGAWHTWRLPKGSYTHDGSHGWHTEWPRIRQLDPDTPGSPYLMHMHGLFYDFPGSFSSADFSGLSPICDYYKMPVDYCMFDGRLVMAKNDASKFDNDMALRAQSNFWFGDPTDLLDWGAPSGHGAVWMNDSVAAGETTEPFLVNGFSQITLHLRNEDASAVSIGIQTSSGDGAWTPLRTVNVPANSYIHEELNALPAQWVRLSAGAANGDLTAFFHLANPYPHAAIASFGTDRFAALADIRDTSGHSDGIVRVMSGADLQLEFASDSGYHRIGGPLALEDVANPSAEAGLRAAGALTREFGSDAASAWIDSGGTRFRLPKLDPFYDSPFLSGWARGEREVVTERDLLNLHGTFYEVPRDNSGGKRKMRALATHGKRITDFTSWRGLLVLTGVLDDAPASDSLVRNEAGDAALWLGEVDDIWQMGEPRGSGGPWNGTAVAAGTPSDPYLMYGYDHKVLTLSSSVAATITVEVDFLADDTWSTYQTFALSAGETITHTFPDGFHAHWVRLKSDTATTATAQFDYGPAARRNLLLDWAREEGLPTASGRDAVAGANTDGDELPDLAEFVLGTDPAVPNPWPVHVDGDGVRVVIRDLEPADGIAVAFETTTGFVFWEDGTALIGPDPDQTGVPEGFTRLRFPFDPQAEPRRFVRLKIDLAQ